MPHSPERHQRHRTSSGPSAPKCPSSEGSRASGPDNTAAPVVLDLSGDPSDSDSGPDDQQLTQQSSEFHQPSQSAVAEGSDKTVERLWRWKSFFRHRFSDIETLVDQLEKTVEEKIEKKFVDRFENLETNFAALYEAVEENSSALQQMSERLDSIEERFAETENSQLRVRRQYERFEESASECGSLLGRLQTRHGEFEKLQEQAYDVLQVLRAD
ncbi:hypothetical protein Poli38472_012230 [Pythium oligandrum]|uniref:Uncharacterized protein n=1 Tax=Pythium oligandrum TaxID=41045 RepID=A0A8K1CPZ9_PYTOL|nr:hypothetical protein Poli38472_012230 [Pythium oligandrum]|eukprot:TMW67114.1 hypothetical protein Poli38472_012230 [Pythium oligandrum]